MFYDFITKLIFLVEKMREKAVQKLLTFLQQKYWHISDINVWNFNETLTNNAVSFEQLGPGVCHYGYVLLSHLGIIVMRRGRKQLKCHFLWNTCLFAFAHFCHLFHSLWNTVEIQWLEHWWLVYHGCFELVLVSLGKHPLAANLG